MTTRIGMMMGDPAGIGAELTARVLAGGAMGPETGVLIVGDPAHWHRGQTAAGSDVSVEMLAGANDVAVAPGAVSLLPQPLDDAENYPHGESRESGGAYMLDCFRTLLAFYKEEQIDAICFAPLNKHTLKIGGMSTADEGDWLEEQLQYKGHTAELNVIEGLWTSRVTSHVPLRDVADLITVDGIVDAVALIDGVLKRAGMASPKIMVAGLNPHAGDNGTFGREELDVIGPAVEKAKADGYYAEGPFSPDTMFLSAKKESFDAIVTMYHDQGQIAMKLMDFEHGVTVLGGLPVPISTPAQGSAFDIAGKGVANPGAMTAAFKLAEQMGASN